MFTRAMLPLAGLVTMVTGLLLSSTPPQRRTPTSLPRAHLPAPRRTTDNAVTITPTARTVSTGSVEVTITWCGYGSGPTGFMDIGTRVIKVNNVDVTGDFDLQWSPSACGFTGSVADEVLYVSTGTVTVDATTGPVTVFADVSNFWNYHWDDTETFYPLAARPDVHVRPVAQFVAPTGSDTARFVVTNRSNAADTLSFVVTECSGVASSCTRTPTSSALGAGDTVAVKVAFTASGSAGQPGLIRLRATNNAGTAKDSSWVDLTLAGTPSAGVTLVGAAPGRNNNALRAACVTVALTDDAASECGDLRLAHAAPGVRTMGQWRTPTLLYHSQQARPRPVVQADVRLSAGVSLPPSVTACIKVGGTNRGCTTYSGSDWGSAGQTRRLSVLADTGGWSSGITEATLEVTASNGNQGPYTTSAQLFVLDRRTSPFGIGWWLAGLEQLQVVSSTELVWTGGDGSIRKYVKSGSVWYPTAFAVADSIIASGSGYARVTPENARVFFGSTGVHDSTVNVAQHVTRFVYASGLLTRIQFPSVSGTVEDSLFYTSGVLDSIRAPGGRTLRLFRTGSRVDSLQDPDAQRVRFASGSGILANVVTGRTDRRGNSTTFSFDAANRLTQSARPLSSTLTLAAAESRGLTSAAPIDSAYTRVDGPRSDVADVTQFWVNGYGAPVRTRTAEGQETFVRYAASFPGLVDSTVGAERLVTRARYNARGLPDSVVTVLPYGSGNDAVTAYRWHASLNQPLSVRTRTGASASLLDSALYASDSTLSWTQRGADSTRRVRYTYTATRLPATLVLQGAGGNETSTFAYSALGNARKSVTPLGALTLMFQDDIGRDTLTITPRGTGSGATDSASLLTAGVRARTWFDRMHRDTLVQTVSPTVTLPNSRVVKSDTIRVRSTFDAESQRLTLTRLYTAKADTMSSGFYSTNPTEWDYDALGRVSRHKEAGMTGTGTTFRRDAAGNDTSTITPRGDTIRSRFDALDRVTRRIVPQKTFSGGTCQYPVGGNCLYTMPDVEGPTQCIAVDTARFHYTSAGLLRRAENNWAKVRRSYYPNGQLAMDTLVVRRYETDAPASCGGSDRHAAGENVLANDWAAHTYALAYEYDLAGRRTVLRHPTQLDPCSGRCAQTYAYHADAGTLDTLGHPSTSGGTLTTRLTHDAQGRWTTLTSPGSVSQTRTFDADGRVTARSGPLVNDALTYDAAGQLISGTTVVPATSASQNLVFAYNGLGALQYASGVASNLSYEEFKTDALGNRLWIRDDQAIDNVDRTRYQGIDAATGQLTSAGLGSSSCGTPGLVQRSCHPTWYSFSYAQDHDAAGNVSTTHGIDTRGSDASSAESVPSETQSFYDAADRLTYFNRHVNTGPAGEATGVFEEYRYDALGRRVFVRSRRPSTCSSPCEAYVQRTVWDGDQILYEIRSSGGTNATAAHMELEGGAQTGESVDLYGIVAYAHAEGIDQPVGVLKQYASSVGPSGTWAYVTPHANYQGVWSYGTDASGSTCVSAGAACPDWPGYKATVDGREQGALPATVNVWWGTTLRGATTTGGPQYLRNRYYDATTGRFTQLDPIGVAGGLNLYGFGGGDPVNYADPFGLCPWCKGEAFREIGRRLQPAQGPLELMGAVAILPVSSALGAGGVSFEVLQLGATLRAGAGSGILTAAGVAQRVAAATGGTIAQLRKSEGFSVTVYSNKNIVARIKSTGDMRVGIDRLGSLTRQGEISSDRGVTHFSDLLSQELIGLVQRAKQLVGVSR